MTDGFGQITDVAILADLVSLERLAAIALPYIQGQVHGKYNRSPFKFV
ncbi:MAG: hypothetical protein ACI9DQ_001074, partial [Glaciecola sp.]